MGTVKIKKDMAEKIVPWKKNLNLKLIKTI